MWYEDSIANHKATEGNFETDELIIQYKNEAKVCWDAQVSSYNIKNSNTNSNFKWMKTVMSSGVLSDKIASYIMLIQESPVHNLSTLSNLVDLVKVGKKRECLLAIDDLVELFLNYLLPPNRKLLAFRQRPLSNLNELTSGNGFARKKYLSYWYFEDQLKEVYALFVKSLNTVAHDTGEHNKEKALGAMSKLLCGNPEQEKNLLIDIVNKLGDPSVKIASKASYCLTQLLKEHQNMQAVVLQEIEKLLFRANISSKAQYYSLCFLSQFYLSHEEKDIARSLIELYFSFFKACVKKGDVNSRMMSALLMGVNRAYPYAKMEIEKISDHINTVYRIVHVANFNISLHALSLLFQVSNDSDTLGDRFYSALYKKLLDPTMSNTAHQAMVLSLTYKALLKDSQPNRVKVFVKRLLQNALYMQPPLACGLLFLISQVLSKNRKLYALDLNVYNNKIIKSDEGKEAKLNENINDCFNRNPLYAGGNCCVYEELIYLKNSFHPTISLFANNIMNVETIKYTGDPLQDFSLIRFLDRFVFKNPKKTDVSNEGSHSVFGKRKRYMPSGVRSLSVNSNSYINSNEKNIPIEELFLYSHLQSNKEKLKSNDDSDLESVNSEEFEDMLDNMTKVKGALDDLDYLDDVNINTKSKKNESDEDEDLEGSESEQEEEEVEDQDLTMTEEDQELTQFSDENLSDVSFDSESEDEQVSKRKNKKRKDEEPVFAPAEEFAAMLEDEGAADIAPGGSDAWMNHDKSNEKQIKWEEKRNKAGQNFKSKNKNTKTFGKGSFGKSNKFNKNKNNKGKSKHIGGNRKKSK